MSLRLPSRYPRLVRALLWALLALLLAGAFASYLQPDFMLDLANRTILC